MRALALLTLAGLVLAGCLGTGAPPQPVAAGSGAGGFSATSVFPGDYDTTQGFGQPLQKGPFAALPGELAELETPDGTITQVAFVRPNVPEGILVPVVALASPYFAPLTADSAPPGFLTEHGYAFALVAVRGTAGNKGCMEYFGPGERADLDHAITWLGTQPWSSGSVGMLGGSYDGGTQYQVAATGNPHLKTIVPLAAVADPFTLLFSNGTAANRGVWHPAGYWQALPPAMTPHGPWDGMAADRFLDKQQCQAAYEATFEGLDAAQRGERTPFWEVRDPRPGIRANYKGSIFVIQGLQDFNVAPSQQYPFTAELQAMGVPVKQLLGQWVHMAPDTQTGPDLERLNYYGFPYILGSPVLDYATAPNPHVRWDFAEILLRWYDYWLKEDTSVDLGPVVQVEDTARRWRDEARWPPADAQPWVLYLAGDGLLGEAPGADGSKPAALSPTHMLSIVHVEDAGAQGACGTCAVFVSQPLDRDVHVSGIPQLKVTVTPQGPGGQVYAYLYAVQGTEAWRVGFGSVDLRFADGSEQSKPVVAGQAMEAIVQLEPLDALVPQGWTLQLVLTQGASSDHATALEVPFQAPFPFLVEAGGERSALTLPLIERGEDAFFEPPS